MAKLERHAAAAQRRLRGDIARDVARGRYARGLTQAGLAALVGTDQRHIHRIESGAVMPRPALLARLDGALLST